MNLTLTEISNVEYEKSFRMTTFEDAEADFLVAFCDRGKNIKCIYDEEKFVGIVQLVVGRNAFIYSNYSAG